MSAITLQPKRLSMRYSAGKLSQEDLIESDNQEPNNVNNSENPENPTAEPNHEHASYKEDTFCDYVVNICQCTSWLCANLVSSIVLCFESCIDFVHTSNCKNFCCDVCGGSEHSLEDHHEMTDNTRNKDLRASMTIDDDYIICFTQDIEEVLPDSCVIVEKNKIEEEKTKNISNKQTQLDESEDKKSWI